MNPSKNINWGVTLPPGKIITAILAVALGAGIYEHHEALRLRESVQALQQQQVALAAQTRLLQQEQTDATRRLGVLLAENARLKASPGISELLQLRGELSRLKATEVPPENNVAGADANTWRERVGRLKQYIRQHPDAAIPEFQYLTDREWLIVVDPGAPTVDFAGAVESLKSQAISRFANVVSPILQKYAGANHGRFPRELSQLRAFCDPDVAAILQQRYEIKPGSVLPPSALRDQGVKTDWVVAGKDTVQAGSADHLAIYTNGYSFFW
jgi:hypothetical protein